MKPLFAVAAAVLAAGAHADAPPPDWSWLRPAAAFAQAGAAEHANAIVAGLVWESGWEWRFSTGRLGVYWEASLGRWSAEVDDRDASALVTQIGVTPVLRFEPARLRGWFLEAGIGAHALTPIYRSRGKTFSTTFNFGDHLALGRRFGPGQRHELALRLQHFSNGGIRRPNPGEDFIQLRYSVRL